MSAPPLRATASSGSQSSRSVKDADVELDDEFRRTLRDSIENAMSEMVDGAKAELDKTLKAATNEQERKLAQQEYKASMQSLRAIAEEQFQVGLMLEKGRRKARNPNQNPVLTAQQQILDEINRSRSRRPEDRVDTAEGGPREREPSNLRRRTQDASSSGESQWFHAFYPSPVETDLPAPIPIGRTDNIDSFTEEEVAHSFGNHATMGRKQSTGSLSSIRSKPEHWRVNGSPGDSTSASRAFALATSPQVSIPTRRDSGNGIGKSSIASSIPRSSSPPPTSGIARRDSNASAGSSRSAPRRDSDGRSFAPGTYGSVSTPPPPSPYAYSSGSTYPYAPSTSQPSPTKRDKPGSFFGGLSATAPRQRSPMPPILSPPPPPAAPSLSHSDYRQNLDIGHEGILEEQHTGDDRGKWSYSKGKDVLREDGYKPSWVRHRPSTSDLQQRRSDSRTSESPVPVPVTSPTSTDYPITPESYRPQASSFMGSAMRRFEPDDPGIPISSSTHILDDTQGSPSPDWPKNSPIASIGRAMGRKPSFDIEHRARNPSTSPVQSRMWAMQHHRPVKRRTSNSSYRSGRSSRSQSIRPEVPTRAGTTEDWPAMPTYEEMSHDGGSDQSDLDGPEWEDMFDDREITRREQEAAQREREVLQKLDELRRKEEEILLKESEARRKEEGARQKEEDARQKEDMARLKEDEVRRKEEIARRKEAEARKKEEEAARKTEEARKLGEEAGRKAEDARKLEEDARRKEEDARKKEEDARKLELDARKIEVEARRKEEKAELFEEKLKKMEEDALARAAYLKRKEEDARRKEEEARRREEDARRKEEDARRKEEDARKKEEDARRREEDARERSEEARQRMEEAKQKSEEARQRVEGARIREDILRRKEEEVKQKEEALRRREEDVERREAVSRRQQEERLTEEYLAELARSERRKVDEVLVEQQRIAAELLVQQEERKQAEELAERLQQEEQQKARDLAEQEEIRRREVRAQEDERRNREALAEQRREAELQTQREERRKNEAAEALAELERQNAAFEEQRKADEEMQRQQHSAALEDQRKAEEEARRQQQAATMRQRQEEARRLQDYHRQQEEARRLQQFAREQEELRKQMEESQRKRQESAAAASNTDTHRTSTPYSSASQAHSYTAPNRYSTTSTGSTNSNASTWSNGSSSSWSNKSATTASSQTSAGSGNTRTAPGNGAWRSASTAPYAATPEPSSVPRRSTDEDHEKAWRERQEEQARKQAEAFQREQERIERERQARAGKAVTKEDVLRLLDEHERQWTRIPTLDTLSWNSFAWPTLKKPSSPEELTTPAISAYVLNPYTSSDRSEKDRIKEHIRRWHPDRFETKLLPKVRSDEREKVKEGAGAVVRSLNELLTRSSSSLF